ncbi:MAG: hypothetical protein U9R25_17535 [Chloroflexota bacterium]|nr:hypothetical protein [Chloroflexota bacterium]
MSEPWSTLIAFSVSVLLLYLLQRWISLHMQGIGILLFNSKNAGMTILWVFLLPGIILHEFSHWLAARLLGLKTGRFSISPEMQGQQIILGSVEIQKTNPFLDSLVGLAPFLAGTLVLLLIGYWAFDVRTLAEAWEQRQWNEMFDLLTGTVRVADSWLWLYLIVAVSNAMMPSPTDRSSWRLVLIYLGITGAVLLLLGGWPTLPTTLVDQFVIAVQTLTYAFGFTLLIDVVVALFIAIMELILSTIRGQKVVYK